MFTGYHVEQHDVTEHKSFVRTEETIWEYLTSQHNYDTGLFTPNVIVSQTSNLGDAFETCVGPKRASFRLFESGLSPLDIQGALSGREFLEAALSHRAPLRSIMNGIYKKIHSRGGSQDPDTEDARTYINELLDWVHDRQGPWAACLNLMDTHTPFEPKPEFDNWSDGKAREARNRVRSETVPKPFTPEFWEHLSAMEPLYDGTIRQADAAVESLVDALRRAGELEETLLIVTSDHGEGLGERSELDTEVQLRHHSWGIDEVLTHVPLIVRPPGSSNGRVIDEPATLTRFPDIVRSAISDEGVDGDEFVPGGDVVSSTYRIVPPGEELELPEDERMKYFGPWRAVYRKEDGTVHKYTRRGSDALTLDVTNIQRPSKQASTDDGVVETVFDEFQTVGARCGQATDRDIAQDTEDRLEDLGYLR